jgi:hypothetical protein
MDALPERFKRVSVTLDGNAAYAAWKAGELPRSGFRVERSRGVRVY